MAKKNITYRREGLQDVRVVYHDGPPAIGFAGRQWQRGVPQTVSAQDWDRMQARGDFGEFDFKTHPHPNPLPSGGTEALEGEGKIFAHPLPPAGEEETINKE